MWIIFYLLLILIGNIVSVWIHELGHFMAAKWLGVRVKSVELGSGFSLFGFEFQLGLKPRLSLYKSNIHQPHAVFTPRSFLSKFLVRLGARLTGQARWTWYLTPFAGAVEKPRYVRKRIRGRLKVFLPYSKRKDVLISLAGPFMNLVLACVCFYAAYAMSGDLQCVVLAIGCYNLAEVFHNMIPDLEREDDGYIALESLLRVNRTRRLLAKYETKLFHAEKIVRWIFIIATGSLVIDICHPSVFLHKVWDFVRSFISLLI